MRKAETPSSNVTQNKNEELRQKMSEKISIKENTIILQAKFKIQGYRTPFVEKVKCEDNIPEVRTTMKLEKTVTFRKVSDSLRRI